MKIKPIIIVLFLIHYVSYAQEKDLYVVDNSYYEIYRDLNVKSLKVITKEYENGSILDQYVEVIQNFDNEGNIIYEREVFDSDTTDGWVVTYKYNKNHQIVSANWKWMDDGNQELTTYEYTDKGKLIQSCDYSRSSENSKFTIEHCDRYEYKDGRLNKILRNEELISYFEEKDGVIFQYSKNQVLKSKYKNGESIYVKHASSIVKFERNKIGQLLKSVVLNEHGDIEDTTVFEYTDGLLMKVYSKNDKGILIFEEQYVYEYE